MARNTAAQGAAFERQVRGDLERYGYLTMRSAASKGAADVVAFARDEVLLVQAKLRLSLVRPADRIEVVKVADVLGPRVGVPLLATKDGPRTVYRLLTGTGPKDWLDWHPEPTPGAPCAACEHVYGDHPREGACPGFEVWPLKKG